MPNTTLNYKNYRSNTMESRNGRPTSGHCIECGTITSLALGGKRVTIPSQKNGVWVCNEHRGKKNLNDYCDENGNCDFQTEKNTRGCWKLLKMHSPA